MRLKDPTTGITDEREEVFNREMLCLVASRHKSNSGTNTKDLIHLQDVGNLNCRKELSTHNFIVHNVYVQWRKNNLLPLRSYLNTLTTIIYIIYQFIIMKANLAQLQLVLLSINEAIMHNIRESNPKKSFSI